VGPEVGVRVGVKVLSGVGETVGRVVGGCVGVVDGGCVGVVVGGRDKRSLEVVLARLSVVLEHKQACSFILRPSSPFFTFFP